jgi:hypothetical protein
MSNTDESSAGAGDGTASVSVTGGTPPYTYVWSNAGTSSSISALLSGAYQVTVTGSGGCTYYGSVAVNAPGCAVGLNLIGTDETSLGANDGSATVTITGGTAPYSILWSTNDTVSSISGLAPGVYSVVVTDSANCVATSSYTVNAGGLVGLQENGDNESPISVFPNPANGMVNFKLRAFQSSTISIYNLAGLHMKSIKPQEETTKVSVEDLAAGLYFYRVSNDVSGNYSNGKFIVSKR